MDTLGALALATEPPHEGLMSRPPVGRDVSFITKTMWRNIIGHSIYQLAILLTFNFAGKQILRLEGSDATKIQNTFIFNTFVFCQVCILYSIIYSIKPAFIMSTVSIYQQQSFSVHSLVLCTSITKTRYRRYQILLKSGFAFSYGRTFTNLLTLGWFRTGVQRNKQS